MHPVVPRPGILDIIPYKTGDSAVEGVREVIKLASNENPLGPSPRAIEAYHGAAQGLERYPEGDSLALRQALADKHDIDPEHLVCAGGSEQFFNLVMQAYTGPGDEVLFTEHAFISYRLAAMAAGATPVTAPESDFTTNIDALLDKTSKRTRVLCLANPNNPTGTYISYHEVELLRERLPAHILLVLDAAYAEYVEEADYHPGSELVRASDNNVMMTRTFSKIYALPGLRVGWAHCPQPIAEVLNRVRCAFNVTTPAQVAAIAALGDDAHVAAGRAHNKKWRNWLTDELTGLGLTVTPSVGNFLLVHFPGGPEQAAAVDAETRKNGVILRPVAGYGLPQCLRITIGLEHENRKLVDILRNFLR